MKLQGEEKGVKKKRYSKKKTRTQISKINKLLQDHDKMINGNITDIETKMKKVWTKNWNQITTIFKATNRNLRRLSRYQI